MDFGFDPDCVANMEEEKPRPIDFEAREGHRKRCLRREAIVVDPNADGGFDQTGASVEGEPSAHDASPDMALGTPAPVLDPDRVASEPDEGLLLDLQRLAHVAVALVTTAVERDDGNGKPSST